MSADEALSPIDEALSPVEALLAALSVKAGELSRGDRMVLSPACVCPNAVPGAVKPNKHSVIRMWCTAMRPESIGLATSLQVYSA